MSSNIGTEKTAELARAFASVARSVVGGETRDRVHQRLNHLASVVDVDVLAVTENILLDDDTPAARAVFWVDTDAAPASARHSEIMEWSRLPATAARLADGHVHRFSSLDELDETDRAAYLASPAGLRSVIEIPIVSDGRWEGHILLANRARGREWTEIEVLLLQSLSDVFASAWAKEKSLQIACDAIATRDVSLRHQHALAECSRILLTEFDEDASERALRALLSAIGFGYGFLSDLDVGSDGQETFNRVLTVVISGREPVTTPMPPSSNPLVESRIKEGKPLRFATLSELDPRDADWLRRYRPDVESGLIVPIQVEGRVEGVVGISSPEHHEWSQLDIETMTAGAAMFAANRRRTRYLAHLEDLVTAKDRFVATVSHELRTPMAVVHGLASELEAGMSDFTTDEINELMAVITSQTDEMSHLVEDLLLAARMDAGLTVIPRIFDASEEVQAVVDALPAPIWEKLSVHAGTARAYADPLRMRQILRNLILNAERHGGPNISVEIIEVDAWCEIRITDDGDGIPTAQLERIFDPYVSQGAIEGRPGSIGLGLSVSRDLALLMNGNLTVESAPGSTTFTLRLPSAGP